MFIPENIYTITIIQIEQILNNENEVMVLKQQGELQDEPIFRFLLPDSHMYRN